jgi:MoxR-like ATPase
VRLKVPDLAPQLARQAVELVHQLRGLDLKKSPSISETLDWARALVQLNAKNLDEKTVETTMTVLLKHETDIIRAKRALSRRGANGGTSKPGPSGFDPDDFGSYRMLGRK